MANKALGWDVTVSGPYTLAVDGVSTTELTPTSTLSEIESALNETSGPVGLDVAGDPASTFSVSTDTPAELTGSGAEVTVTVPEPEEPGPEPDDKQPVRVTIRIDGKLWFADDVYDPQYAYGGVGNPITFSATVAPPSIDSGQ
jgi:hypothetical protein